MSAAVNVGLSDTPMTFLDVVAKGTLFTSPLARYPHADAAKLVVMCDRCLRRDLKVFVGCEITDLCLECVQQVSDLAGAQPVAELVAEPVTKPVSFSAIKKRPFFGDSFATLGGAVGNPASLDDVWGPDTTNATDSVTGKAKRTFGLQHQIKTKEEEAKQRAEAERALTQGFSGGLTRMMCFDMKPKQPPPSSSAGKTPLESLTFMEQDMFE